MARAIATPHKLLQNPAMNARWQSPLLMYGLIAALAIAARASYAWLSWQYNFFPDLFLDSQHYANIAQAIADGRGAGDTAYVMSPLYPYFLSLFVDDQHSLAAWWVRLVQMSAGVATCLFTAALARHYGGVLAGWIAGMAIAVYGPLIHYETSILVEVMQAFTFTAALWLLVVARHLASAARFPKTLWASSGVLLGLAAGFRPVALLVVAATIAALLLIERLQTKTFRPALLACLLIVTGSAIAVLPFTVRNYVVSKELVLLSAYGGMNFWIGNHKGATGLFNTPPDYGFHFDPIGVEVARKTTGQPLTQKEASAWWSERALADIRADPVHWLALYLRKIALFFHPREIPQLGNDFDWFAKKAWPLQFPLNALPLLLLAVSLPLTLLMAERQRLLPVLLPYSWLAVYIAGISLFFITGRYRTPIMPLVFVLASTHCAVLGRSLLTTRQALPAVIVIIAILFGTVALSRIFNRADWLPNTSLVTGLVERQRGMAFYNQGKFSEAEKWYRQSLAIKENPITRGNLANALKAQGRIDEAETEYTAVLAATPKDYVVWYNLANLYRDYKQDLPKAAQYYQQALTLNKKFGEPYLNLALLYLRMGQRENALQTLDAGISSLDGSQYKIRDQLIRLKVETALKQ